MDKLFRKTRYFLHDHTESQQPSIETSKRLDTLLRMPKSKQKRNQTIKQQDSNISKCVAYCTGEEIDIMKLKLLIDNNSMAIEKCSIPDPKNVFFIKFNNQNKKDHDNDTKKPIFVFPEMGVFVSWNCNDSEKDSIMNMIKSCQSVIYDDNTVYNECDSYVCVSDNSNTSNYRKNSKTMVSNGKILVGSNLKNIHNEQLAISHSLALSVKLSFYERFMDQLIESIIHIPENLKNGKKSMFNRSDILKKSGEIEYLRLLINLDSDFLNLHDMYWDFDDIYNLFEASCNYLDIKNRTEVLNQKLHHSTQIIDLLRHHLSETHGHRLEWLIIVLIFIEVILGILKIDHISN